MTYVSSGWRVDGLVPAIFWKQTEFSLWILDFVGLSHPGLALLSGLPGILQTKGLISWEWWLPLGCCHLRPWLCVRQRIVRGPLPPGCPQWSFPSTDHQTVPNQPWKIPNGRGHSLVESLLLVVGSKSVWDNGHCHGYRPQPPTHFSEQVLVWRWSDLLLTLACSHAGLEVSDRCGFHH